MLHERVERVVVHAREIDIVLKAAPSAGSPQMTDMEEPDDIAASSPVVLKASFPPRPPRARKEILLPGASGSGPRHLDHALVLALARARSWMVGLQAGDYSDTAEIAGRFGLSEPHVRRLLRLAFLAPDIVAAIVEGRQPRSLKVKRLLETVPLAWTQQRMAFGFAA